jgi:hypothetical protein
MALPSAYPKLGKFLFPSDWRPSLVGDEFTDVSAELFIALLRGTGPGRLGYFSDLAYEVIDARYLLYRLTGERLDSVRHAIDMDVREAMSALDMLGVVVLHRNSEDAGQYGITDWSQSQGGTHQPGPVRDPPRQGHGAARRPGATDPDHAPIPRRRRRAAPRPH